MTTESMDAPGHGREAQSPGPKQRAVIGLLVGTQMALKSRTGATESLLRMQCLSCADELESIEADVGRIQLN